MGGAEGTVRGGGVGGSGCGGGGVAEVACGVDINLWLRGGVVTVCILSLLTVYAPSVVWGNRGGEEGTKASPSLPTKAMKFGL